MSVLVAGVGARTAVGATAPATAAAVRAGIAGFGRHRFMVDTAGQRMIVAAAPYLTVDVTGLDRFTSLAQPALVEALAPLVTSRLETLAVQVYLGVPASRPGRPRDMGPVLDAMVEHISTGRLKVRQASIIEAGHSAGTMAIEKATAAIESGGAEFALAGGVDTYMEPETLEWLEANDQIHSAGPDNNAYGFIPGEAGTFALLTSPEMARRFNLNTLLEVSAVATAYETKLIKTDAVCTGEGLVALFRSLAARLPGAQADDLYCDMNGEPYRADEFGFASIRAGDLFKDASEFNAPADCWGDVGAASGSSFLVLAEAAARKGYALGPIAAAFTSSESGERSGFITRVRRQAAMA